MNVNTHELKIDKKFLQDIRLERKTFEIRKDDRPYERGDFLFLKEFDQETKEYGDTTAMVSVRGVFGRKENEKPYVREGYVILSIILI